MPSAGAMYVKDGKIDIVNSRADKGKEGWISRNPCLCDTDGWSDRGSIEYRDTSGVRRSNGRGEKGRG